VATEPDEGTKGRRLDYRVRLIPDSPADADEFAAKGHERVANAIAALMELEEGGRVVGLEGEWGSGKSTVVRLIREALANGQGQRSTRVLVIDAWAHQGDPLRRTFLEAVIRELGDADWLTSDAAERALAELSGRSSHVTTTSTSRLSFEGKLAAAATVLLALGAAFFNNHFSHHHGLFLAVGSVFLVAPLVVVLGLWIARAAGRRFATAGTANVWSQLAALKPWSFLARDQETDTVTHGIQQAEPTSVEFERIFSHVLRTSLMDDRQLVLVLDNLDRVDEEDARKVLSTMQTFVAPPMTAESWAHRVWTLIPYDAEGLERLWTDGDRSAGGGSTQLTVASAFLDKLFQLRFEAPPLVLSDWRGYTMRLLQEALPDEPLENLEAVLRLRALYPGAVPDRAVASEAPTPRQLKQFVNQIGAMRRQRDDVPVVHIGYYVLLRRDSLDLRKTLIDGGIPHTKLAHLFDASVREDVAALHFGADRLLAQQLLLGPAIEGAFSAGDSRVISSLGERPGFVDALEGLDFESRASSGGIELTRAVSVLGRSGALSVEAVKPWASAVLDPLSAKTQSWRLQGRETGEGLALLLHRISANDDARLAELLKRVEEAPVEADTEGRGQLEGLAGLADELADLGRVSREVRVVVDLPTERLVDSVAFLNGEVHQPRGKRVIELAASPPDVATALVEAATSNRVAQARGALDLLLARPERVALDALASGALTWLRANEPVGTDQLDLLLAWLDRARSGSDVESTLGTAADDGTLLHLLAVAATNGWFKDAAAASMLHFLARPELPELPTYARQSAVGINTLRQALSGLAPAELVDAQLEWLKAHRKEAFELIAKISKSPNSQPWVDHQMQALSDADVLVTSPSQFVANWAYLRRVLGPEHFQKHTRQLLDNDASRQKIVGGIAEPQQALDLLVAAGAGDEPASYLGEVEAAAADLVQRASPEEWSAALEAATTTPLISLAFRLVGTDEVPRNLNGLQHALHEHFKGLAEGTEAWQPSAAEFKTLTEVLTPESRRVLASQFCAELEGRDGQVGPALFTTYGDFLGSEPAFRTHSKLPNVVERFVARDQWPVVAWFVELAKREPESLDDKGRADEMEHLRATVSEKLRLAGDSAPEELKQLAALFGLSVEASDPPESAES
jgi:hypothetical protein